MQEYCPVFSFRNWKSKKYVGNDVTFYHLNWGLMGREIPLESSRSKDLSEAGRITLNLYQYVLKHVASHIG